MINRYVLCSILCLLLSACRSDKPTNGIYKVRVPMDDGTGQYVQQTVELKTVTNLSQMEGTASVIKARGRNNGMEINPGYIPHGKFIKTGDNIYIPQDPETLLMTTNMVHFERLKEFYDQRSATAQMTFPQKVMVQADFSNMTELSVPTSNSAMYISSLNLFVFSLGDDSSIPVSMNSGVISHEYFHSVFAALTGHYEEPRDVWSNDLGNSQINFYMNSMCFNTQKINQVTEKQTIRAQQYLMDSINEGMADYFAYEYTKNPSWILATLPGATNRNLAEKKYLACGDESQKNWIYYESQNKKFNLRHEVGSIFARFLYTLAEDRKSHGDSKSTPLQVLKFVGKLNEKFKSSGKLPSLSELTSLFVTQNENKEDSCTAANQVFTAGADTSLNKACGSLAR